MTPEPHKLAEINQDALRVALNWALDEIDALSNKLVQFGYPQGILMLDREDQAEGYWNACDARRALDEWRCPKCGVQADERWNCCEVHPEAALPQEGAAVAPVVWAFDRPNEPYRYFTTDPDGDNIDKTKLTPLYAAPPSPATDPDAVRKAILAEREACVQFARSFDAANDIITDWCSDPETCAAIADGLSRRAAPAPSPAAGVDAVQVAVLAEREKAAEFVRQWPKTWALDPKVGKRFRLDQVQWFINGTARAIAEDILAGYRQSEASKPDQETAPCP